jgi:hypothetical protein
MPPKPGRARRSLLAPLDGPRPAKPLGEAGLNSPPPPYRPAMPTGVRGLRREPPFRPIGA